MGKTILAQVLTVDRMASAKLIPAPVTVTWAIRVRIVLHARTATIKRLTTVLLMYVLLTQTV